MSCEHEHHRHGPPPIETNVSQSLTRWIDTAKLTALNMQNPTADLPKLFKTNDDRYAVHPIIKSDLDSELLIHIPFECPVKLYSIILRTSSTDDHSPKTIKVYKNALDKTFDDLESLRCEYEFTHPRGVGLDHEAVADAREIIDDASFAEAHLPRRKFSGVGGVSLHFTGNWGGSNSDDPEVILFSLEIRGESSNLRGGKIIALYEAAPQARGSKLNPSTVSSGIM